MKSESDFQDLSNYRKYLKYYYAGQILQGLIVSEDHNLLTRQVMAEKVDKAAYLADRLIRTLESSDET